MKKKLFSKCLSLAMAAVLVASTVAGCAPATPSESKAPDSAAASQTPAAEPQKEKQNVTISLACIGDGTWILPIDEAIIEDFTKETGIKIDIQKSPVDQYANLLKTKLASGEGPDMMLVWPEANSAQFFPDKNFLDLSDQPWVQEMSESAKRNATYNGRIVGWGAEGGNYSWGILYSKEIFDKLNLKIPKSFDEFVTTSATIKEAGIVPFYGTMKEIWTLGVWMAVIGPLAERNHPGLYDKLNNNTAKFADVPEFEQYINDFKRLYDEKLLGENPLSGTVNEGLTSLVEGKTAMAFVNCFPDAWLSSLELTPDMSKYAMFPAPFVNNNTLASYDGGLLRCINKNGKNIEACKAYLSYISRPEVLEKYYSDPQRSSLTPAFNSFVENFEMKDSTKSLFENSDKQTFTIMEAGIKYWDNSTVGKYVMEAILGQVTPKQALEQIDTDRNNIFAAQEE